ncbi:DUF397 domain-containing protein [Streptomyces xiangluensis]|uniref:DUF397 domain-containing protein n=1 Tax=Streptomyces xiangluensis TaxID=2665720 RepID=A0ABV8YLN4_9ACTN
MNGELKWFKSSYSDSEGGACVEVATSPTIVHIRDSKLSDSPELTVPAPAWKAFVSAVQPGA